MVEMTSRALLWVLLLLSPATAAFAAGGGAAASAGALASSEFWGSLDPELVQKADELRPLCDQRPASEGCGPLALFYSRTANRLGEESDRAVTVYRLACVDGYAWGCYLLAEAARAGRGGVDPSPGRALSLLQLACDEGERRACLELGRMHETGEGVPVDLDRAAELYDASCAIGWVGGCWELGRLLQERRAAGDDVDVDRLHDSIWRGCTGGIGPACYQLGLMEESERDNPRDAAYYFSLACDRKHVDGCIRWADYLLAGEVVRPDPAFAVYMYEKACFQGDSSTACLRLAGVLRAGEALPRNEAQASELEARACELGDPEACESAGR